MPKRNLVELDPIAVDLREHQIAAARGRVVKPRVAKLPPAPSRCNYHGCRDIPFKQGLCLDHFRVVEREIKGQQLILARPNVLTNIYYDFYQTLGRLHLTMRDAYDWRLVTPNHGQINGLPNSRGILVATNGIDCLIETPVGFYEGHIGWWQADEETTETQKLTRKQNTEKTIKVLQEYIID